MRLSSELHDSTQRSVDVTGLGNEETRERREYPISSGWRLVLRGLAVAAALFGGALVYLAIERFTGSRAVLVSLLGAFFLVLGLYLLMGATRVWVVITPTELVYREPFQEKKILLAQVTQWDAWTFYGITMLNLRDAGGKSLGQIPLLFKRDAAFDDWLSFAPNRHELRAAEELASIQQEKLLGASPEGRVIQMERARRVMWALNFLSVCCAVWLFVYPKYEELAVVSCLIQPPLVIALMFLFPGAYDLEFDDHQVRPTAAIPLITSSFALGFRSLIDGRVVEWAPLVLPFLFGTFILGAVLWMASRPGRLAPFVFSMCILWANPLGAWALLNRYLDRSRALEKTTVVVQRMEKAQQGIPLSLLTLTSPKWSKARTVQTDSAWQRVSEVRDVRCFVIHPGAFGMRWFSLDFSCNKPTMAKAR